MSRGMPRRMPPAPPSRSSRPPEPLSTRRRMFVWRRGIAPTRTLPPSLNQISARMASALLDADLPVARRRRAVIGAESQVRVASGMASRTSKGAHATPLAPDFLFHLATACCVARRSLASSPVGATISSSSPPPGGLRSLLVVLISHIPFGGSGGENSRRSVCYNISSRLSKGVPR